MSRKRYFVSPNKERGGWDLQGQNSKRASRHFDTKDAALEHSRPFVRSQGNSQLVIQKRDGTIQTEHTYGADPEKYPG
jgi:hypothetical protein